ncbi:hypothetical protein [Actinosynnema sp. NPDC023587]|uniref:hypothetical protein n=1 Tax=Actinosynnema sp. NPDC023587 TaxID=3154695 RepID=UPI0033FF4875
MNQPWPPGRPYGQQQPDQPYPGQPGHGPPQRQSGVAAVVAALLFLPAAIFTFIAAFASWDGTPGSAHLFISLLGLAFSHGITGNADFAITLSTVVAPLVLVLALLLAIRLPAVRWVPAALGALCAGYYAYATIRLLDGSGGYLLLPIVALLLWLVPAFVAALPPVGRAIRTFPPQRRR